MRKIVLASSSETGVPSIVCYKECCGKGVSGCYFDNQTIGYLRSGHKYLYDGEKRIEISAGSIFYLDRGYYYIEEVPSDDNYYEEYRFHFNSFQMSRVLNCLNLMHGVDVHGSGGMVYTGCSYVVESCGEKMEMFFSTLGSYLRDGIFVRDENVEFLKLIELVYYILRNDKCRIKDRLLLGANSERERFYNVVYSNIFNDLNIEELSALCDMSTSSFKKRFYTYFNVSPHKWFIMQRLRHSRLLLMSTGKSLAEISKECRFSNTSHYIKLFKLEYGLTPATYRETQLKSKEDYNS